MNTFVNHTSKISVLSRAKVVVATAAIALGAIVTPVSPAAAAAPAAPQSQIAAGILLGPLTIPHMRAHCWSVWHTFSIYKVGLNWRCNRPVGFDPVVNYNAACKKAYNKPTAFASGPNALGMRRCYRPFPIVSP
jgi:hypothetical protein